MPLSIIISLQIISKIKKLIWPNATKRLPDFFKLYSERLELHTIALYQMLLSIGIITYFLVKVLSEHGINISLYAFTAGTFIGFFSDQFLNFAATYRIKLTALKMIILILTSAIFASICVGATLFLIHNAGFSGKAATILSVVGVRLLQPFVFNLLLLRDK